MALSKGDIEKNKRQKERLTQYDYLHSQSNFANNPAKQIGSVKTPQQVALEQIQQPQVAPVQNIPQILQPQPNPIMQNQPIQTIKQPEIMQPQPLNKQIQPNNQLLKPISQIEQGVQAQEENKTSLLNAAPPIAAAQAVLSLGQNTAGLKRFAGVAAEAYDAFARIISPVIHGGRIRKSAQVLKAEDAFSNAKSSINAEIDNISMGLPAADVQKDFEDAIVAINRIERYNKRAGMLDVNRWLDDNAEIEVQIRNERIALDLLRSKLNAEILKQQAVAQQAQLAAGQAQLEQNRINTINAAQR